MFISGPKSRAVATQTGPSTGASTRMNTNDALQMTASASRRATSAGRIAMRYAAPAASA